MSKKNEFINYIIAIAFIEIIAVLIYIYSRNEILNYNDAESHINIAKRITSCLTPGFSQIGGVWLPLQHILIAPFVVNDWFWNSGIGGSIPSVISFILAVYFLYKLTYLLTKNTQAAIFASVIFMTNCNILYFSVVPMQEILLIFTFLASAYYLCKWEQSDKIEFLIASGIFSFLMTLTRYDGWFLSMVEIGLIMASLALRKFSIKEIKARLYVFAVWPMLGIMLWLAWNFLIFGTPFYFASSQYSAASQQQLFLQNGWLPSYHNATNSVGSYLYAVFENVGFLVFLLGAVGLLLYVGNRRKFKRMLSLTPFLLLTPIVFYSLSLYLGQAILLIPYFMPSDVPYAMFNVRYGIVLVPAACVFAGFLINTNKLLNLLLFVLVFLQTSFYLFHPGEIVAYMDGKIGLSSQSVGKVSEAPVIEKWFRDNYAGGLILYDDYSRPLSPIFLNIPMNKFIYVGAGKYWNESLRDPSRYASYIVIREGDALSKNLTSIEIDPLFNKIFTFETVSIYQNKKFISDGFVYAADKQLMLADKSFQLKGVNSYDLAYKTDEEIKNTFINLQRAGVNTIRFWFFGDGFIDGFQPEAGIMNEERFKQADLIIATANEFNIKLIPTLVNNWRDLGGKMQYLEWVGKAGGEEDVFYSDEDAKKLMKNYINHIISRENGISHKKYTEETSILAWDIINEPRANVENQEALESWVDEMAKYIKQIDRNHLVSVGTEQATSTEDQTADICGISGVDMCSVHLYLFEEDGSSRYSDLGQLNQYMVLQASHATKINKPIIVGEFGASKRQIPFGKEPLVVLRGIAESIIKTGYNGFLVWNWSVQSDDSFGFSIVGDEDGEYDINDLKTVVGD